MDYTEAIKVPCPQCDAEAGWPCHRGTDPLDVFEGWTHPARAEALVLA